MDERLRDVEGEVKTLNEWRDTTVDPWISSGKAFRDKVGGYITRLEAQEELRQNLNDERHQSNNFKLNMLVAISGILAVIFAALLVVVTYQAAHQKSILAIPPLMGQTNSIETAGEVKIPYLGR